MKSALFSSTVLSVLAGAPGAQEDAAARLIPSDTAVLVRLDSARELDELVHSFAPLAGEDAASFSLQNSLGPLEERLIGDAAREFELDPSRPLYFAVAFDPASGPSWVWVLPMKSDALLPLSTAPTAQANAVQLGRFLGLSNSAAYAALAAPNALAELHPGVVSAHVDLRRIIETFRPLIDTGLRQAELMVDQMKVPDKGIDMGSLLEEYLAGARALVDSAEALDLALERDGDELAARLDFRERADHPLGLALDGPTADVSDLLGRVDPASAALAVYNGKWTTLYLAFQDFVDAALDMYPEPLRADMRAMFALQKEIEPQLPPGMAMGFDFDADGMRASYVMRSERPAELESALEKAMRVFDHEGGMLHFGASTLLAVDGLEACVLPLTFDFGAFAKMIAGMHPDAAQDDPGLDSVQQALASFYGRDLRIALAHDAKRVLVCLGNGESHVRADLARMRTPVDPPAELRDIAGHLEPGAPGFAYQVDFGRFLGQMFALMRTLAPAPLPELEGLQARFSFWGSKKERTCSAGVIMSLADFMSFARKVEELEQK